MSARPPLPSYLGFHPRNGCETVGVSGVTRVKSENQTVFAVLGIPHLSQSARAAALGRAGQEDCYEFKASSNYTARFCLQKKVSRLFLLVSPRVRSAEHCYTFAPGKLQSEAYCPGEPGLAAKSTVCPAEQARSTRGVTDNPLG